ncbi:TlyA family RNA methyltransferase [Microlunatus soli]|uniref:23S rRNA (Cytidine1920-2'-O)/16S rRNA (Cytidine1409-2'-O)-methyltransferase n=1 Tax=Microlunatus soli TaxID=630515 RepID=A0A1H1XYL5_9ACTN|nr:TlyA family RNA methyltransferase [Microlunatus soli]SDT14328.1 23S rRNA (cytidine1920-2'-O)/16S rRNA (cytidine1409-2'-O)-methyltransferase [Microlunatus soli]
MTAPSGRSRLDVALARRGLARSRSHARELIDAGTVLVNESVASKASLPVESDDRLALVRDDPYVSRAAYKLIGALDDLAVEVPARVLDAGASTGGFSQVLLERGCRQLYAIDVGHDQLHPRVSADPRVIAYEGLNLRDLDPAITDGPVDLVVADVSFISLTLLLDRLIAVLGPDGSLLTMIKPQFEVGRELLGKGGVVRSDASRRAGVAAVVDRAAELGWHPQTAARSRLPGPAGNIEYFVLFGTDRTEVDVLAALFAGC